MVESDDIRELRRCMRDLLALTALSAYWSRADASAVAEGLADVALRTVQALFVLVRINGLNPEKPHEVIRVRQGELEPARAEELVRLLRPLMKNEFSSIPTVISNPLEPGRVRIFVNAVGFEGDSGFMAVGSQLKDFPTEADKLLLRTAANQAAIILQHRQAEATLRASEERFSRFMQQLPGVAWIKDASGRYVYANDAAVKAFRVPREKLYGRTDDEIFPPETAAQFKAHDESALLGKTAVQMIESLEHDDGVLHHSVVNKFAIPGLGTDATLVGGVAIDITDRLKAEKALRDADRRKDEFLATLAHELRNPLAPIRNGLQLLNLAGTNKGVVDEARAMMDRQIRHMVRLVDDLLDISRITRGKLELRKEAVELADIIKNAVETSRPQVEASRHELIVTLPPESIPLEADPARLSQVFSNLINNAAKYTESGGRIWLSAEKDGNQVVVRVRDNGIGIPTEMLEQIFEMFIQVDRSLEKQHGGLGVGLTLVKRIVEMHGGTIVAHSERPGEGSEFVVTLPALSGIIAPRETPATSESGAAPARHRLLVADDNADSAESLAMLLRYMGNEVCTAHDGVEAVELAHRFQPDAVLLDIGMPKLNGYEAARRIRDQPWGKGMMLIALTGWGQPDDKQRAADAGFDHHLTKPVDPGVLEKLLERASAN